MRAAACIWLTRWLVGLGMMLTCGDIAAASSPHATLTCFVDGTGHASAGLLLGALLPNPQALAPALGQMLGTGARDAQVDVDTEKHVVTCNIRSAGHFDARQHRVRGELRFGPLLPLLQSMGVRQLDVQFTHPRAAFTSCPTLTQTAGATGGPWIEYSGALPLAQAGAGPVSFEFGYRDKDLILAFVPLLLVAPLPVLWAWRRQRRQPLPVAGHGALWLLGMPTLLAWGAWTSLVVASRADVIALFLAGLVQPTERMFSTIALVVAPPALALGAARWLLRPRGRVSLAGVPSTPFAPEQPGPGPMPWILPALFTATGLATWRDSGGGPARVWWAVAGAATLVILGQRAWMAALHQGGAPSGAVEGTVSRTEARAAAVKWFWVGTTTIFALPLGTGWLIGRFQIDQPASGLWAGGALLVTLIVLTWAHRFRRQSQGAIVSGAATRAYIRAAMTFLLRLGLAWVACSLLDLPLDLEHGDEGLIALTCIAVAAAWDFRLAVRSSSQDHAT
jgi:hypothetical protein